MIRFHSFGIFPPEGAIPKTNTVDFFSRAISRDSTIGIFLSVLIKDLILFPTWLESIIHVI